MRRSHALLVAILCALSLPARGQALILYNSVDHDWSIHYGTNRYGLVQESLISGASPFITTTTIWVGSRHLTVNHTIWPVAVAIAVPLICIAWFLFYGLSSVFTPDKKPPPPDPSPPP